MYEPQSVIDKFYILAFDLLEVIRNMVYAHLE